MDKKQITKKIEEYEYYNNACKYNSGAYVDVVNVRIKKRDKIVIADVKLGNDMDGNGTHTRYNNVEYPMKMFEGK